MTIAFAASAAVLGLITAVGHSLLSERKILQPLLPGPRTGVLASRGMRDIIRLVFHIPSMVWATLALALVAARLDGGNELLSTVAAVIFAASGIGNLVATRRPHIGGLMILGAAFFTVTDALIH